MKPIRDEILNGVWDDVSIDIDRWHITEDVKWHIWRRVTEMDWREHIKGIIISLY